MPNYDFKCTQCDTAFKKSMPYGSKELVPCPKCGGKTQRLITIPAMIFKGSGFYKTDSVAKPVSASSPSEKTDTKSDAKAETPTNDAAKTNADASSSAPAKSAESANTHTNTLSSDAK